MFWNSKPKLPVTPEDKEWVEAALIAIKADFGEYFDETVTILPTKDFYNYEVTGTEADAEFVLEQTKIYFTLEDINVKLRYFSDEPVLMEDGTTLSTPADIYGRWNGAAGTFEDKEDEIIISIETSLLKNPMALIATIAHELSHFVLLKEYQVEENDEYLTDLVAIASGFGIFLGNTHFQHSAVRINGGAGWQMKRTGYLPEQIIAYAMAWMAIYKNEDIHWKNLLKPAMLKFFNQSIEYIQHNPHNVRFG